MNEQEILDAYERNQINFEQAMNHWADTGAAPNLLYDDNGLWAVDTSGMQTVPDEGPIDMDMQFWVQKDMWKPTIREALIHALTIDAQ